MNLGTLEALKPMIEKPLSSTLERILESAHERLSRAEDPSDRAPIRSVPELMQPASRKSRLTAAEFLNQKPESRK